MNKTVSVNIGGYNFIMDEVACEKLSAYLQRYRNSMRQDECDEVMYDIESRIAEIFGGARCTMVITEARVDEVIETIGEPEVMTEGESVSEGETASADNVVIDRKLYRDTDDCVIGGVCSGLGGYFNISVILVRALFLLGFFLWCTTLIIYLLMWLLVPQARGARERLAMKGGFDAQTGARADGKKNISDNDTSDNGGCLGCTLRVLLIGFAILMAFPLLMAFGGVIIGLVVSIVAVFTSGTAFALPMVLTSIFGFGLSPWLVVGALVFALLPVVVVVLLLLRLIFRGKWGVGPVLLVSLGVWIASLVLMLVNSADVASHFKWGYDSSLGNTQTYTVSGDTLYVKRIKRENVPDGNEHRFEGGKLTLDILSGFCDIHLDGDDFKARVKAEPELHIRTHNADKEGEDVKITVHVKSKGETQSEAVRLVEQIRYHYEVSGDTLYVSDRFSLGEDNVWRFQGVKLDVSVPDDVKLEYDNDIRSMMYRHCDF